MSLDRSLKTSGALDQHRNVLKRPERIAKLLEMGDFKEGESTPIHLRKVANRKIVTAKKPKKQSAGEGEDEATTES